MILNTDKDSVSFQEYEYYATKIDQLKSQNIELEALKVNQTNSIEVPSSDKLISL